jgi:hypothetical protein
MINPGDLQLMNVRHDDRIRRLDPNVDRDARSNRGRASRRRPRPEHGAA